MARQSGNFMSRTKALIFLLFAWMPVSAVADAYLYMAEEAGCYWCAKWNAEIAHIYPKTQEGKAAPLRRFDLQQGAPNILLKSKVRFTPTFILVDHGKEVGRIEGYPGDEFFWSLLNTLLESTNNAAKEK